jgi:hypothetical protein
MQVTKETRYSSYSFLTLTLDVGGQLCAPAALYPPEHTPGNHWIGGYCSGYKIDEKPFASTGDQTCYPNNEDMPK